MKNFLWLGYYIGLVAAGGGGNEGESGGGGGWQTTTCSTTEYWTETYTSVVTIDHTTTTLVPYPVTVTDTDYWTETYTSVVTIDHTTTTLVPYPVTVTDTDYVPSIVPTTVPITYKYTQTVQGAPGPTVTVTETQISGATATDYLTNYLTNTEYFTSLVQAPIVTVFITTTTVETSVETIPPSTITTTQTTTTSECEFCKIDIYATALQFPLTYITTAIYATTYDVYTITSGSLTSYSTATLYPPTSCLDTPVSTWVFGGVVLTSPTTYIAYTSYSHGFLQPQPSVYGCGELVFEELNLGPSASDTAALILNATVVPTTLAPAPPSLLSYLDTIPTVVSQLGGIPAYSCDTPSVSVAPLNSQLTNYAGTTQPGPTTRYHQATGGTFAEGGSASPAAGSGNPPGGTSGVTITTNGEVTTTTNGEVTTTTTGGTSTEIPGTSGPETTSGSVGPGTGQTTQTTGGTSGPESTSGPSEPPQSTSPNSTGSGISVTEGSSTPTITSSSEGAGGGTEPVAVTVTRTVPATTSIETVTVSRGNVVRLSIWQLLSALLPILFASYLS